MEKRVDARGLMCPEPVLLAKKAIEGAAGGIIRVLVDSVPARENVTRLAEKMGWKVEVDSREDVFELVLSR